MNRRSPCSPRALARGGVSWVTALLLGSLAAGAYLAWVWIPVYFVHYEAKQVVRDYMYQAVKNSNDAELVSRMCRKLEALAQVDAVGEDGTIVTVPAVQVSPYDVTWQRDTSTKPPMLYVSFAYTRPVFYPGIDRFDEKTFEVSLETDIGMPDWGPAR